MERRAYTELFDNSVGKGYNACVRKCAFSTEHFNAELIKLSRTSCLRFFVSEERAEIVEFERHRLVVKAVFDKASYNSRRTFGTQTKLCSVALGKGEHFLLNYVGSAADAPLVKRGKLKGRYSDFVKAVRIGSVSDNALDTVPDRGFFGQYVKRALWFLYCHFKDSLEFC